MYDFPFKPGCKEWEQFESIEKRIAALQIPDAILYRIPTENLLDVCLDFPYLTDIFFYDDCQKGFEALTAEFNGFKEILKRADLTDVLLHKYETLSTDVPNLRTKSDVEQGRYTFRHFVLEYMLAQDIVCKNLKTTQEKKLFLLSSAHKKIKNEFSDIFGNMNFLPTNLLYAKRIMNDPDFKFENAEQKEKLSDFIQAPIFIDPQIMGTIEDYINNK
jgi:hypothetical protein